MGFACPVCEIPHQDATHLANHLAFTAMTHADDHEAWLDDHVPEWSEYGETDLASEVGDLAPEAEYDQLFEDTVGGRGGAMGTTHDHGSPRGEAPAGVDPKTAAIAGQGGLDDAARAVLEEARGLTAEMLGGGETPGAREEADADGDDPDPDPDPDE
ncbi:hypothetical protein GCM10008995_26910 [Halobellus salinus]|uniref:Uncharacterized protein n=1 Tax=Halobellus salinus TaxID=931585 RepID=A0A830EVW9_9EURY|nr:DUF5810 domain-containing protein [Halobellus salinus]GGJ15704.1 hypothetical protein GCM10008995_26910 [Halobellus salinus]SMP33040.1 hypothetical protein SAMN06265347_12229 [Halobellus salinus]